MSKPSEDPAIALAMLREGMSKRSEDPAIDYVAGGQIESKNAVGMTDIVAGGFNSR